MAEGSTQMDPAMLAAVVAAIDASWPRAVVVEEDASEQVPRWRFSGRWWSRPAASRRLRPW
jgi:hypothetical protein